MVLAVLPMVELVEVAEGVLDGLEDRFPKIGIDIYTENGQIFFEVIFFQMSCKWFRGVK